MKPKKIVLNNIIPLQQADVGFIQRFVFATVSLYTLGLQLKSILTTIKNPNTISRNENGNSEENVKKFAIHF